MTAKSYSVAKRTAETLAANKGQRVERASVILITVPLKANLTVNQKVKVKAPVVWKQVRARAFLETLQAGSKQLMVEGNPRRCQTNMLHK